MGWCYTTAQATSWDWTAFINTAIAAFLGTAVGALVFYFIEDTKKRQRLEDEQVTATNVAIFALHRAYSDLETFRKDRLQPKTGDWPARWFQMRAGNISSSPLSFDASTLAFLFESKTPDIPAVVQIELDRYHTIRADISDRTRIHVNELQPRIEAHFALDPTVKEGTTEAELIEAAGQRIYHTLQALTDAIVNEVERSIPAIASAASTLREAAKAKFPKNRKIIRFEPLEEKDP
jgi:hypothetical protein